MKEQLQKEAQAYGVKAGYSGRENKMFISGDPAKVKAFIRIVCLRGKGAYPFSVGMGK